MSSQKVINLSGNFRFQHVRQNILHAAADIAGGDPAIIGPLYADSLDRYIGQTGAALLPVHDPRASRRADIDHEAVALFLPAGQDRATQNRNYTVIRQNALGFLSARDYDYIPGGQSFLRRSHAKALQQQGRSHEVFRDMSLSERMEKLLERGAWEKPNRLFGNGTRYARERKDISVLFSDHLPEDAQQYLYGVSHFMAWMATTISSAPDILETIKNIGRMPNEDDMRRLILENRLDTGGEEQAKTQMELHRNILHQLTDYEQDLTAGLIAEFVAGLDDRTMDIMHGVPHQQTTQLYNFMQPVSRKRARELGEDGKSKRYTEITLNQELAKERQAIFAEFPIMASIPKTFAEGKKKSGMAPHSFVRNVLGPHARGDAVDILRGKTENDIPPRIASELPQFMFYLTRLEDPEHYPQNPDEWIAFEGIRDIDRGLDAYHLINESGDFVQEAQGYMIQEDATWEDTLRSYGIASPADRLSVNFLVRQVRDFQNCVAMGAIAPTVLRYVEEWNEHGYLKPSIGKNPKDWLDLVNIAHPHTNKSQSELAQHVRRENNGAGIAGIVFNEYPIMEWKQGAQVFLTHHEDKVVKWREGLAFTRYRLRYGNEAELPQLPAISDHEWSWRDPFAPSDDLSQGTYTPPLLVQPIRSAAELYEATEQLDYVLSKHAGRIIGDERALFVSLVKPSTGQLVGVSMLSERNNPGAPLRLHVMDSWGEYGDDPQHNAYDEALETAIQIWEERVQDTEFLEAQRAKLRGNSQSKAQLADLIGHNPSNIKENRQFVDQILRHVPYGLRQTLLQDEDHNLAYGSISTPALRTGLQQMVQKAGLLRRLPDAVTYTQPDQDTLYIPQM